MLPSFTGPQEVVSAFAGAEASTVASMSEAAVKVIPRIEASFQVRFSKCFFCQVCSF